MSRRDYQGGKGLASQGNRDEKLEPCQIDRVSAFTLQADRNPESLWPKLKTGSKNYEKPTMKMIGKLSLGGNLG
jgi:hypothetical protein